jgi:hypothetical protein
MKVVRSSISRSLTVVTSPLPHLGVVAKSVAQLREHPCGGREIRDLQPGTELVDPRDLPPLCCVLLPSELGQLDERRASVVGVLGGFDDRVAAQPVD